MHPARIRRLPKLAVLGALTLTGSCGWRQDPRVVDLMDGYAAFAEAARDAPADARVAAFREHVLERDPAFTAAFLAFAEEILTGPPERADRFLARVLELDASIRAYRRETLATLPVVARSVAAALDGRIYDVPVYLSVGLFSSNAQVRRIAGEPAIMIGLDALAHDDATLFSPRTPPDLRPLLAHEYFHAWQMMVNPFIASIAERSLPPDPDAPVWAVLWMEGLAGCFSRLIVPDASIARVLSVEGIWDEAEPRLPMLAGLLLLRLDSTESEDIADWFYLSSRRQDIPRKSGYILGLITAHLVVSERGLGAAAALEGERLRSWVAEGLRRIAAGEIDVSADSLCVPSPVPAWASFRDDDVGRGLRGTIRRPRPLRQRRFVSPPAVHPRRAPRTSRASGSSIVPPVPRAGCCAPRTRLDGPSRPAQV